MPPLSRLRVAALAELAEQLRFASRDALLRDLERIEALAGEIEPDRLYPAGWVVERITAYRPGDDDDTMIVGDALLGDLSALVERLCAAAELTLDQAGDVTDADALAERWGVSRKTIARYRRRGLIARRALDAAGNPRLVFTDDAIARFERTSKDRLARAERFSRIDERTVLRALERARRYARRGIGLNEAAARIAARFDRSHEAIRQVLKRHDRNADEPIFAPQGPMTDRERALACRDWKRGDAPSTTAERLARPVSAVRRGINIQRAARLARVLESPATSTGASPPAPSSARTEPLNDAAVDPPRGARFGRPLGLDVRALLAEAAAAGVPGAARERGDAEAMHALIARARRAMAELSRAAPSASALDRIETDLRAASRIKTELMRSQLPTLVRALEARVGAASGAPTLEAFSPDLAASLVDAGLAALSSAIDEFRAERGGRLAARAGLAIDRAAERWTRAHADTIARLAGRAAPRWPDRVPMSDWSVHAHPWQRLVEPPAGTRGVLGALPPDLRAFARLRFGLSDDPAEGVPLPSTLDACAEALSASRVSMPARERRLFAAIRAALGSTDQGRSRSAENTEPDPPATPG